MALRERRKVERRVSDALSVEDVPYQQAVLHLFYWQFGERKNFYTALFELLTKADDVNVTRLALAFPNHALAFERWRRAETDREFFRASGFLFPQLN